MLFYFGGVITSFIMFRFSAIIAHKNKEHFYLKEHEIYEDFSYSAFIAIMIIVSITPLLNYIMWLFPFIFSSIMHFKAKELEEKGGSRKILNKILLIKDK